MKAKKQKNVTPKQIRDALDTGILAKIKIYQSFTERIAKGEQLKPTEIKLFNKLETEFEAEIKEEVIDSYDDALKYLGVSKRTLHIHLRKGTFKQNPDGTFLKSELDKYLDKYKSQSESTDSVAIRKGKADLRLKLARARREEFLVKQLKGNLISWEDIQTEWAKRVSVVTSGLEGLADRLPPLLEGKSREVMREILRAEVWELRNAYTTEGRYCPEIPK